jgi:hypothetical protein
MKMKVTEKGLVIPKHWLEGIDEVEIRREQNMILILPVSANDPILELGTQPIVGDVSDASVKHADYLYNR